MILFSTQKKIADWRGAFSSGEQCTPKKVVLTGVILRRHYC